MKYRRVKIVGDNGAVLQIALGEDGSLHFRTEGDVKLNPDTTNVSLDVLESFKDVITTMEMDIPIGSTITYNGEEFTCWQASNEEDCDGCVFEHGKCPNVLCSHEERADRKNIIFIRRR